MSLSVIDERIIHDYAVENLKKADTFDKYKNVLESICSFCKKEFPRIDATDAKRYFTYCEKIDKNQLSTLAFKRSVLLSLGVFLEKNYKKYNLLPFTYSEAYRSIYFETAQYINPDSLPKLKDIDRLISYLRLMGDHRILFSIILALKLSLTTSEILNIRFSDFIENDKGDKILRIRNDRPPDRFMLMPADLVKTADIYFSSIKYISTDGEDKIFCLDNGRPITYWALASGLKKRCKEIGVTVTYNGTRNLSIAYMIKKGASEEEISQLTNTTGTVYHRYNPAVSAIVNTAVEYNCIYVRI